VINEIDNFAKTTGSHLMTIGTAKGALISKLIAEHKPSTVIELGGFVGYSAIALGSALRDAGGKRYLSLELNPVNAAVANLLIDLAGLGDFVTIFIAPSQKTIAKFVKENVVDVVEFVLIDHWKDRYLPDLWLLESLGLLKPGVTVLAADNCIKPGAPDYLEWVRASPKEKAVQLKEKYSFAEGVLTGKELVEAIKEGKDVELEKVPGDPSYVYETEIHKFEMGPGRLVSSPLLVSSCQGY
jgi:catechol O-methyltransferase